MSYYHLTPNSANLKTGPIAVSTSDESTCPKSCPFKNKGCYAAYGPLAIHWRKLSQGERGGNWNEFVSKVECLPRGHAFRHNQAGDLPGEDDKIDGKKLEQLCDVIEKRKLRAFTYTHKTLNKVNLVKIRKAIKKGFVINISTENFTQVDKARKLGLPCVVVVPKGSPEKQVTPGGNKVILCPAQTGKVLNCSNCMLCQKERSVTVAFLTHGTNAKGAEKVLNIA